MYAPSRKRDFPGFTAASVIESVEYSCYITMTWGPIFNLLAAELVDLSKIINREHDKEKEIRK